MAGKIAEESPPQPEEITDREDLFYRWVPHDFTKRDGRRIRAGAFGTEADVEEGVSFDWNRYSTPERTLGRSQRPDIRAGVVMTSAGKIWDNELTVRHAPELNNQAHSLVKGTSETRVRKTLASICSWALPLPPKAND